MRSTERLPRSVAARGACLLLVALAGCRTERRSPPPPAASATSAAPSPSAATRAPTAAVQPARDLALAPPGPGASRARVVAAQALAARDPASPEAWMQLGLAWSREAVERDEPALHANARACADVLDDVAQGAPWGATLRVRTELAERRFAEARDLADQILAKYPAWPAAPGLLAEALLAFGRYDEADALARRAAIAEPGVRSGRRSARLAWLRGDASGAGAILADAIAAARQQPDADLLAGAYDDAAAVRWHEGDLTEADRLFALAAAAAPHLAAPLVGRARVALAKGDAKVALERLDAALAAQPSIDAALLLGDAREAAGDAAGAAEARRDARGRASRDAPWKLARWLLARGESPEEALALADAAHRGRDDVASSDLWAFALYRAGRLADARRAIDRATRLGTRDAELWFHAGAIRLATGDDAGGRKLLEDALALQPAFDAAGAREAKELLAGRRGSPRPSSSR